jgi:uncharacterized protein with FMN-binding domain
MPYIIAIILVAVIGVGFTLFQSSRTPDAAAPVAVTEQLPVTNDTAAVIDYKDGTYKTTTTYRTPKQDEYKLEVTLLVANDIVTDSQITYSQGAEKDPNAQRFEAAYRAEVIGKDIDTLSLSRVGGASLTTTSFNKALETIKTDAKL